MPTEKSPEIERLMTSITGISRSDAESLMICVWCREKLTPFRDALSKREFQISGLCQLCQDSFFDVPEGD